MPRVGIMQPYFMPYIGYFQLIQAVDKMVIYDNIEYTKKGWINRNRILVNCQPEYISIPLAKSSDFCFISEKHLATDWIRQKQKLKNKILESYRKAPEFNQIFNFIERILDFDNDNLFAFIFNSIRELNKLLNIQTELIKSSDLQIDHTFRSQEKVITICKSLGASTYINSIGGTSLYDTKQFKNSGLELKFIQSRPQEYYQLNCNFVPWLSIIDILMFNDLDSIKQQMLPAYELITTR